MRILLKSGLAVAGALALVGQGQAQDDDERGTGRKIAATLTGGAEVPGPGDDNGAGLFEARVNPGTGRICYTLAASSIDPATAAHIHKGGPSEAGDVVLTLETPDADDDDSEECQDIDRGLAQALIQNTGDYYVNVHNAPFPNGAIRGQLMKG
jgi:hypothetical protein